MTFYLSQLRKFDQISGELGLTAYFEIRWVDETLFWYPEDYGNITDILLPHGTIWKPSFLSGNPYDDFSIIYSDETLILLHIMDPSRGSHLILSEFPVKRTSVNTHLMNKPVIFRLYHGITCQES
jgi:hypothetical protein